MNRYFRSDAQTYEAVRAALDQAWMLPGGALATSFRPAASAVKDSSGRCLLAVRAAFCDYAEVAAILPGLLASGAVDEIDSVTYRAALPKPPLMTGAG